MSISASTEKNKCIKININISVFRWRRQKYRGKVYLRWLKRNQNINLYSCSNDWGQVWTGRWANLSTSIGKKENIYKKIVNMCVGRDVRGLFLFIFNYLDLNIGSLSPKNIRQILVGQCLLTNGIIYQIISHDALKSKVVYTLCNFIYNMMNNPHVE